MNDFFQFEADFVDTLRCIPMLVRMKLDTCGVKLKLPDWHRFSSEERQALVELPCATAEEIQAYREFLCQLVIERTGAPAVDLPTDPHPPWMDETVVPVEVQNKAGELNLTVTSEQWRALRPLQRFALIKLSRSSHENKNFLPALKEFQMVR